MAWEEGPDVLEPTEGWELDPVALEDDDSSSLAEALDWLELEDEFTEVHGGAIGFEEDGSLWGELGEFEDAPTRAEQEEVDTDGPVPRRARAIEEAVRVAAPYGWEREDVEILVEAFHRHGWSQTKLSMARELKAGMTPDELWLAMATRELWDEYPEFTSAFRYGGSYGDWTESITHRAWLLSWPNALAIVRSFGAHPDLAEIEARLLAFYDHWSRSPSLGRQFLSFRDYLWYRLGGREGTVTGSLDWTFAEEPDANDERLDWHVKHTIKRYLG